jgi:hypothetical protein
MAKTVGETGFDKENLIIKMILNILHDTNYKIRLDGVHFLKEYLKDEKVVQCDRFQSTYIYELIELLNDEE